MKNPSPSELNVTPDPTITEPVVVEPDTFTFFKKVALVFVLIFSVPIPVIVETPAPNVTAVSYTHLTLPTIYSV